MIEKLEPILGLPEKEQDQQWVFVTAIPGWYIGTRVELGKRTQTLRYWQSVMVIPDEYAGQLECPSQNGTHILSWLGLGRTEISVLCEEDEEPIAEALANVCRHYLFGITTVLSGLTAEVMQQEEWDGIFWWQRFLSSHLAS